MNAWDFFESVLIVNLPHRTDRLTEARIEFSRHQVYITEIIPGIISDNPVHGFNQAQRNALQACKGNSVIFEDDVTFHNIEHLEQALKELPEDWDILYLGANVVGTDLCSWPEPEYYSEHLRRITQAWTTHAVCYSEKCVKWILENWNLGDQIYDDFLRCNLEKLNAFIIYPMICNQRPGHSDIWGHHVDYGFFNVWKNRR